jgi:hypothetical protein
MADDVEAIAMAGDCTVAEGDADLLAIGIGFLTLFGDKDNVALLFVLATDGDFTVVSMGLLVAVAVVEVCDGDLGDDLVRDGIFLLSSTNCAGGDALKT